MSKKLPDNPFRDGSASHKLYAALAKATKPLAMKEIADKAKVPLNRAITLVNAYQNTYHNAPLRKIGAAIVREKQGFELSTIKPDAKAKRPSRGKSKATPKLKKAKAAKKTKPKAKPKATKKPAALKPVATPAPVPAPDIAAGNAETAQGH